MRWVLGLILLLIGQVAHGQTTQRTYSNANGQNVGRSVTDTRGNTTFYNSLGQNTGRSTTDSRGNTTVYDQMGRQQGTIRK